MEVKDVNGEGEEQWKGQISGALQLDSEKANAEIDRLGDEWNDTGQEAVNDIILAVGTAVDQTSLNIGLSVDLAGSKKMTADNKAGSTINVFSEDITIPAGKFSVIVADSDFLPDTVKGLSILLGQLTSGKIPEAAPPELSKLGDLADSIADGTTMSVAIMTPALVQVTQEMSAKPFFNWIKNRTDSAVKFIGALQQSADAGSLAALGASQLGDDLNSLANDLAGDMFLGLNLGIGASADLGAEGVVSVGAGAAAHIRSNPEMMLLLGTGGDVDLPNATGQADMGFDISMDAGAGVSLGEGVEVEASGGIGFSTSLLSVGLTEWDDPVPQIYGPPASSNANLAEVKVRDSVGVQEYTASPDKNTSGLYTVWVPMGTTSVTIVPKTFSSRATFAFPGHGQMMNGAAVNYTLRKTPWEDIPFSVQFEDGTGKSYILRIQISPSTRLQSLTASKGAWDKAFSPSVVDYKLTVDSDTYAVDLVPKLEDSRAGLKFNDTPWSSGNLLRILPRMGENNVTFKVTPGDSPLGQETVYRINIFRTITANANLASLQVNQGALSPAFSASVTNYTVNVPDNVASINLNAVTVDPLAKLYVINVTNGEKQGEISEQLNLRYGPNNFVLYVKAQDGTKKGYNITVTRVCSKLQTLAVKYNGVT